MTTTGAMPSWEWGRVSRATSARRLAVIVATHVALAVVLLTTGAVTRARIIVPVSIALYVSPPSVVDRPTPTLAQREAHIREELPTVVVPVAEVPVAVSLVVPAPAPEAMALLAVPSSAEARPLISRASRVQLPSSAADYLDNPAPRYPPASKRLREAGLVLLWVLVSADGASRKIDLRKSSGFDRLDEAATETVRLWKFVPGQSNGVAQEMWVEVPIEFKLV